MPYTLAEMSDHLREPLKNHMLDQLRYAAQVMKDRPELWPTAPVPRSLTWRQRLSYWWWAHRPRLHLGPCDSELGCACYPPE